jgi:hypothetical protein
VGEVSGAEGGSQTPAVENPYFDDDDMAIADQLLREEQERNERADAAPADLS